MPVGLIAIAIDGVMKYFFEFVILMHHARNLRSTSCAFLMKVYRFVLSDWNSRRRSDVTDHHRTNKLHHIGIHPPSRHPAIQH